MLGLTRHFCKCRSRCCYCCWSWAVSCPWRYTHVDGARALDQSCFCSVLLQDWSHVYVFHLVSISRSQFHFPVLDVLPIPRRSAWISGEIPVLDARSVRLACQGCPRACCRRTCCRRRRCRIVAWIGAAILKSRYRTGLDAAPVELVVRPLLSLRRLVLRLLPPTELRTPLASLPLSPYLYCWPPPPAA